MIDDRSHRDDPLVRLGAQLREDLGVQVGEPPPVTRLRRRRAVRGAASMVAVVAAVGLGILILPSLLDGRGLTIDPVAPVDPVAPIEDDGGEAAGSVVRSLDTETSVQARVLTVRFQGAPSFAVVDLDRGEVTTYEAEDHGLSREPISSAALTHDGAVFVQADETVRLFRGDDLREPVLTHTPADLETSTMPGAAPAIQAMPAPDGTRLWVVQAGGDCCGEGRPGQAELVDVGTGSVRMTAALPPNSSVVAAATGGLVVNTLRFERSNDGWAAEEGSQSVVLLDETGGLHELGGGVALAATGNHVAVLTCERHEPREACALEVVTTTTGERVPVELPRAGAWDRAGDSNVPTNTPPWAATSHDGLLLVSVVGEPVGTDPHDRTRYLAVIDTTLTTDPTAEVLYEVEAKHLGAAWSTDGRHVIVSDGVGVDLTVIDVSDGSTFTVTDAIPEDHYLIGMG